MFLETISWTNKIYLILDWTQFWSILWFIPYRNFRDGYTWWINHHKEIFDQWEWLNINKIFSNLQRIKCTIDKYYFYMLFKSHHNSTYHISSTLLRRYHQRKYSTLPRCEEGTPGWEVLVVFTLYCNFLVRWSWIY